MTSCSVNDDLDHKRLQRMLASALGPRCGVAVSGVKGDMRCLYPQEARSVAKAVLKRQREFAAGRQVARQAMRAIGWQNMPIPCNADRSPSWPEGLVGSISHSKTTCVAIVSRREHSVSVGIDIEDCLPIDTDLWSSVCTPQELASVNELPAQDRALMVLRIFSAKECYYKWQYPLTGLFLEFHDVAITLDPTGPIFQALCLSGNPPHAARSGVSGTLLTDDKWVISTIA
jgi:enterobactin synthetase component D